MVPPWLTAENVWMNLETALSNQDLMPFPSNNPRNVAISIGVMQRCRDPSPGATAPELWKQGSRNWCFRLQPFPVAAAPPLSFTSGSLLCRTSYQGATGQMDHLAHKFYIWLIAVLQRTPPKPPNLRYTWALKWLVAILPQQLLERLPSIHPIIVDHHTCKPERIQSAEKLFSQ